MKQLLIQAIACCAVLLPFTEAEAKTYGGFKPNAKFTLTVNFRISNKTVGGITTEKVPVPPSMPDFRMGKKITFTIGPKGQLTAKGMSLPFKVVDTMSNPGRKRIVYEAPPKKNYPFGDTGNLDLKPNGKPVGLSLSFSKITISKGVTTDERVFYTLD